MSDETKADEIVNQACPEHAKLRRCQPRTQAAGEFIDWLGTEHGIGLAYEVGRRGTCYTPLADLLAEWAGIDRDALEGEKLEMLAALRATADPEPIIADGIARRCAAMDGES